ncbi:MAG: PilZ domain-containing protein [Pseudomonadota bacterium]
MSVKVKRERPDQRRHHRVTAPLFVDLNGRRLRASDWSLGGINVCDPEGPLPDIGDELAVDLELPFQGFDIKFNTTLEVLRVDPETRMISGKYVDLGEREQELMQHFVEDIIRGAMSDIEDTIQRIDVPVTPASLSPDKSKSDSDVPVKRWPIRAMAYSSAYVLSGLAVFAYASMLVFSTYFNLEITSAVISAPLEQVKAQAEGRLRWTRFRPGDPVVEGDVVLHLYDNKLEREIDLAGLAIKERSNEIAYLMRRKVDELDKASAFAQIEAKEIAQSRLQQESLQEQVHAARLTHVRAEHLFSKGHAPAAKVEETRKKLIALEKELQSQKLELQTRIKVAEKNLGKRHFSGDNVIGDLQRISDEIKRAEGLMELDRQRFDLARMQRHRLAVIAPFTGTLLQLPRVNNSQIKAGETIALFEKNDKRMVTAFLTQDEVLQIELGADVDIYIPATGEVAAARIVDIDRTMGFFRQASRRSPVRLQWRASRERTARVVLAFNNPRAFANRRQYRAGLPVIANFERKTGGYITARAQKLIRQAWSHVPELPSSMRQTYTRLVAFVQGSDAGEPIRLRHGPVPAIYREPDRERYQQIEAEKISPAEERDRLEAIAGGFRFEPGTLTRETAKLVEIKQAN